MRDLKSYARSGSEGWVRDLLFLFVVLGFPFLQFLGKLPLIDPDEGRYAQIPREMLERGDFVTPTLNHVLYFEKPPLLYWINAASLKLFGLNEFAARLPSALCGLLTVLITYMLARRLYDRRTALLSAVILGTSTGFVLQSRIILTDMLLTCCLTSALGAFVIAAQRDGRRGSPLPWYFFYLFSALAVLTKGLIGIVFPAGIIFFYLLLGNRWHLLARMHLRSGAIIFLAVAAPWFIVVSLRNPEFARFFFIHEHFERFTTTVHGRYHPFWFFVPVLAGTMLPWSFFIPGALVKAWRERAHQGGGAGLFLVIWVVLIFLFFSKSNSKLIPYLLPIFPPLAILIGHRINGVLEGRGNGVRSGLFLLGIVMVVMGVALLGYGRLPQAAGLLANIMPKLSDPLNQMLGIAPQLSITSSVIMGALFLVQGLSALLVSPRKPFLIVVVLCMCSFVLEILVPQLIMGPITMTESSRDLALKAGSLADRDTRIVTFGLMQGVSWYTGRRVLVAGNIDELEFGSKQGDQAAWFPDLKALLRLWNGTSQVLFIIDQQNFKTLQTVLHPAPHIIMESGRNLLISNR